MHLHIPIAENVLDYIMGVKLIAIQKKCLRN